MINLLRPLSCWRISYSLRTNRPPRFRSSLARLTLHIHPQTISASCFSTTSSSTITPDADKWISQSLLMDPKNAEAIDVLGRIRYTENRFADALQCFDKALLLEPQLAKAENNRGLTLEVLNHDGEGGSVVPDGYTDRGRQGAPE